MTKDTAPDYKPTDRTKLKRIRERAHYDRETIYDILDAGLLCHVGYTIDDQPYVTPTCHWREGNAVYWHGSSASKALKAQRQGIPVCVTVSHMDGLVMARSGLHHSINYRSVMLFGTAHLVEGRDAKEASLKAFMDRIAPGRWEDCKPVTGQEIKGTMILGLEIDEVVAKVRTGPPADDEEDYALDIWAGVVPITTRIGKPVPDPRLKAGIEVPAYLKKIKIG